jgi:hypothetical protein
LQKKNNPSLSTITLASLVKGEVLSPEKIRATTGGIATPPTLPKPHYPLLCTITLASLVKGRWIDGTTQTFALLLSVCDTPTFFYLSNFSAVKTEGLPHHHPSLAPTLPIPQYPSLSTTSLPPLSKGVLSPEKIRATTGGIATPPTLPKPHYPLLCTITLASLVKGEVLSPEKIRATTGGIAPYPHQLSQSRTIPCSAPCPCLPSKKGRWHGCRGFSACCTVFR